MIKLVEIAKSWIIAANPTPEQQEIAEYRVSICEKCPHKQYHSNIDIFTCELCGCPLNKKVYSSLPGPESCPDKRWKK